MGRLQDHKVKWKHNRDFPATIPDKYGDWIVTVAFYTAVHAVEALFSFDKTRNHTSHVDRNRTLRSSNRYKQLWKHYRPLLDAAQTARYNCSLDSWIPVQKAKSQLVEIHLYAIERSVQKLLRDTDQLAPITWADAR